MGSRAISAKPEPAVDVPPLPPATLRLRLDLDALAHNWRALHRLSAPGVAGAAVKANCYGLGVDACVPVLWNAGCRDFFVAHWAEVPAVAGHVPPSAVSVLHGPVTSAEADYARAIGVRPVINSLQQAELWQATGGGRCDLMIDTGMNRLGIRPEEASADVIRRMDVDVAMSHLSSAEEDCGENARQLASFRSVLPHVPHRRASLANSAGIMLGSDYHFDLTRPGLALYGGVPHEAYAPHLRPVARIEAMLIARRHVRAGETVGYNRTFRADEDMAIGIVSLGYADGFLRVWGAQGGYLLSNRRKLPLIGRVSMDMVAVSLREAPELCEGDFVEVPFNLPNAAALTGLSQYELLTTLGRRLSS